MGYLVLINLSGACSNSQGKAAKPVGTKTFILEGHGATEESESHMQPHKKGQLGLPLAVCPPLAPSFWAPLFPGRSWATCGHQPLLLSQIPQLCPSYNPGYPTLPVTLTSHASGSLYPDPNSPCSSAGKVLWFLLSSRA